MCFSKMFEIIKSPAFQFLINPSTLFIIAGMLVAKYGDDPVEPVPAEGEGFMNSSIPNWQEIQSTFEKRAVNHSLVESYHLLDPVTSFEMRLISLIIQGYDNSTQWQFKFVDLPSNLPVNHPHPTEYLPMSFHSAPHALTGHNIQHKANVLVTDLQEHIPAWAVVNLSTLKVESWTKGKYEGGVDGDVTTQAKLSEEEKFVAGEIALADEKVQEKIQKLGYNSYEVVPDVWDAGFISGDPNLRLVQIYFYGLYKEEEMQFARPYNFVTFVELGENIVREIEDLPLHLHTKMTTTVESTSSPNSGLLSESFVRPNTIRDDLYRFKASHQSLASSFRISGSKELHR